MWYRIVLATFGIHPKEKEAVELKTIQSVLNGQYDDSWVDIALKKS